MCWMPGNVRIGSCSVRVWHSWVCWSGGAWNSCSNDSKSSLCVCTGKERSILSSSVSGAEPRMLHTCAWCPSPDRVSVRSLWLCGILTTNQDSPRSFIFTTASKKKKKNLDIQICFPLIRNPKHRQAVISNWFTAPGFSDFLSDSELYSFPFKNVFP